MIERLREKEKREGKDNKRENHNESRRSQTRNKSQPTKKSSHRTERHRKIVKKATQKKAYVAEEESEDAYSSQEDPEEEYEESDEEEEHHYNYAFAPTKPTKAYRTTSTASHRAPAKVHKASRIQLKHRRLAQEDAIIDTGCNGPHLLQPRFRPLLNNLERTTRKVHGLGEKPLTATHIGQLGKAGRSILVDGGVNLFSVTEVLRTLGGSYQGNLRTFKLLDSQGRTTLRGHRTPDGLLHDVLNLAAAPHSIAASSPTTPLHDHAFSTSVPSPVPTPPTDHDSQDTPPPTFYRPDLTSIHRETNLSARQLDRAAEAHQLCHLTGHPGSARLQQALDNGNWSNTTLTSADVRLADRIYGPCPGCTEGKMHAAPTNKISPFPPPPYVGHTLCCDLLPYPSTSIGGNTFGLFAVEKTLGYIDLIDLPSKSNPQIVSGFKSLLSTWIARGVYVKTIQVDHESTLISATSDLASQGVTLLPMPAHHHEKTAERYIQTMKSRARSMTCSLSYQLPDNLTVESYHATITLMNRSPNSRSGNSTPHQLITKLHPIVPKYYFGQTGIFYRKTSKTSVATWGIFLSYDLSGNRGLRGYVPGNPGHIYSFRRFVPHPHYPPEWGLNSRINPPRRPLNVSSAQEGELLNVPTPKHTTPPIASPAPTPSAPEHSSSTPEPTPPPPQPSSLHEPPNPSPALSQSNPAPSTPPHTPFHSKDTSNHSKGTLTQNQEGAHHTPSPKPSEPFVPPSYSIPTPKTVRQPNSSTPSSPLENYFDSQPPTPPAPQLPSLPDTRPIRSSRNKTWKDGPVKFRVFKAAYDRVFNDPHGPLATICLKMSIRAAYNDRKRRKAAEDAVIEELENMERNSVMDPILLDDIPSKFRKLIISGHMFLKDKFKADGSFDRLKARLVARGDQQDPDSVDETFAPTVNPISVMTQLNLAAHRNHYISSYDIKSAFLLAPLSDSKHIYLKLPKDVTNIWTKLRTDMTRFLSPDGHIYVKLRRTMYGLQEFPHEFNSLLDSKLKDIGLTQCKSDKSVYVKVSPEGPTIISTHVDDILCTTPTKKLQKEFETLLKQHFEISCQYDNISYLGLNIHHDRLNKKIRVDQRGYTSDLLHRFGYKIMPRSPGTPSTLEFVQKANDDSVTCDPIRKKRYLSATMSLMFLARFTRPDILMPVTALASRTASPTEYDERNLNRILRYLSGSREKGLCYDGNHSLTLHIYADASHGLYPDGKGHGGIIITLGTAPTMTRSFKLKSVTRSTTESELYALEEACTYVTWYKMLLFEMGLDLPEPAPVYQDNKSTIILVSTGGNFKRTKHLIIRDAYVKERLDNGDIELKYLSTKQMPADLLTKPNLTAAEIKKHLEFLHVF